MIHHEPIGHEVVGHGPHKVLVLHGWFGDHTIWEPTYRFLDQDLFSYAFIDYRGYGLSRDMGGERSIEQISADAIALADHHGWERFSVIGHSMGGQAAQRIAVDAPERVQALVGVTPVAASGAKMPPEAEGFFGAVADSDETGHQLIDVSLGNRLKPEVAQHIMRFARATTELEAFRSYGRAFIETDFGDAASKTRVPMLILVGQHDQGVTEESVRAVFPALHPHVDIEMLPNSGHYPMLETPAWLITRIEWFLGQKTMIT